MTRVVVSTSIPSCLYVRFDCCFTLLLILRVVELLTSDRSELTLKKYRNLEKHFLLAAIFLERPEMTEEGAYKGLKLSYSSSLEFVKCMLRLFQCEKDSIHTIDDNVARVLIDAVFGNFFSHLPVDLCN